MRLQHDCWHSLVLTGWHLTDGLVDGTELTAIVDGLPVDRAILLCRFGYHPDSDFSFINGGSGSPFRGYTAQLAVWRGETNILSEVCSFYNIPRRLAIAIATDRRLGEASPLLKLSTCFGILQGNAIWITNSHAGSKRAGNGFPLK